MRVKIRLDTKSAAAHLSHIASLQKEEEIYIRDGRGLLCAHAKSVLGVLYSMEFSELWLESPSDLYFAFREFIVEE